MACPPPSTASSTAWPTRITQRLSNVLMAPRRMASRCLTQNKGMGPPSAAVQWRMTAVRQHPFVTIVPRRSCPNAPGVRHSPSQATAAAKAGGVHCKALATLRPRITKATGLRMWLYPGPQASARTATELTKSPGFCSLEDGGKGGKGKGKGKGRGDLRAAPGTARRAAASQGFAPPPRPPLGATHRGKVFDLRKDAYFVPLSSHFPAPPPPFRSPHFPPSPRGMPCSTLVAYFVLCGSPPPPSLGCCQRSELTMIAVWTLQMRWCHNPPPTEERTRGANTAAPPE